MLASMKALPKRKGNQIERLDDEPEQRLNESPSKKEGKYCVLLSVIGKAHRLNESPSKKEGK